MSSTIVYGTNAELIFLDESNNEMAWACCRDFSISKSSEMIETSLTGNGMAKTFRPAAQSHTVSFGGVQSLSKEIPVTMYDFLTWQKEGTKLGVILRYLANNGKTMEIFSYIYISSVSLENSFDNVGTFRCEAQGTEPIEITQSS